MQILYRMIVKKSIYKMIVPPDILSKKAEEAFFYLFRLKNTRYGSERRLRLAWGLHLLTDCR